jgi:hypothetical protein
VPQDDRTRASARLTRPARSDRSPWNWLLLLPLLVTLYPPLYNHRRPELWGIPFFYWYQLVIISVGVGCTYAVYRVSTRDRRG